MAVTNYTQLSSSNAGQTLASGYYYVTSNTTCSNGNGNGLTIGGNDVKIYIKKGCSLTVTSKSGNGTTGGYAGIYLTTGSLYVYGDGKLNVTGGNASDGSNGGDGSLSGYANSAAVRMNVTGGTGGAGGGGAGAGIGTNGGTGGAACDAVIYQGSWVKFPSTTTTGQTLGNSGNNGTNATSYNGKVYIQSTIYSNIKGGNDGNSGSSGASSSETLRYGTHYIYGHSTGGKGGSGGGAGNSIGTGGGGGAGGAGGGASAYDDAYGIDIWGIDGSNGTSSSSNSSALGAFTMNTSGCTDSGTLSPIYFDADDYGYYLIPRIYGLCFEYTALPSGCAGFYTTTTASRVKAINSDGIPDAYYFTGSSISQTSSENATLYVGFYSPKKKDGSEWKEGIQSYFKKDNNWKRIAFIYTKVNGDWKKPV